MGSNQNLKAYVRYDGSNRVVAGSLIFRRKKPKVGKWHEIAISECCEYIPTSTTTTTSTSTSTSTTTTTTTQALNFYNADYASGGAGNPCVGTGQFNLPLVVDLGLNPCGGATVTLALGTWASYGITPGATIRVNFDGSLLTLNVFDTNSSTNYGCTSC